ncbi:MAG: GxxExxY protein [Candidatus Doudnabacteria bacterium]|nr:GxxExxY protein [Candidatus Doudnabacteria bacterium]
MRAPLRRNDLVLADECYEILGALFEVYKQLGGSYQEKIYQRGIASEFRKRGIPFAEQVFVELKYGEEKIGTYFLDFIVYGTVVLEIKKDKNFSRTNITQVRSYLEATKLQLGILANFTDKGVRYLRIVNLQGS